jgi:hypothetical protein
MPARPAAVVEGYDDDADYAPAAPPPPRQARPPRERQAPAAQARRHDPLAERSAAIEEALRGHYAAEDDAPAYPELDDAEPAEEPAEPVYVEEEDEPWPEDAGAGEDWHEDRDEAAPPAPRRARPAARASHPARQLPSPGAYWAALPEKTKIRVLIGAIGALGVVLLVAIVVAMTSVFTDSPGVAEAPAQPGAVVTGAQPATSVASEAAEVTQSFTLFDGSDPTVFESSPDNPVRFDKGSDGQGFARISSSTASPGVRLNIGPGIADRLAGQPVRVVIVARAARENGAANLRFAYQSGVALSHWQTADLAGGDTSYGLVWRVPRLQTDPNGDYVLIEPGIPGDGTAAEIRSVRLDLLAKEPG